MGNDVARELTEPNITQLIGSIRVLQTRVNFDPRLREILRNEDKKSKPSVDPRFHFKGTQEEFRFLIRCLEKVNEDVKNERPQEASDGPADDLKVLNEQIATIVESNEQNIKELQKEKAELKDELEAKDRRIRELEDRLTSMDLLSTSPTLSLQSKLSEKSRKAQEFQNYIQEVNQKTLEMVFDQFKTDAADLAEFAQKCADLELKLAQKTEENEKLQKKIEYFKSSDEMDRRIDERVLERLVNPLLDVSEEMAENALEEARRSLGAGVDEEFIESEARRIISWAIVWRRLVDERPVRFNSALLNHLAIDFKEDHIDLARANFRIAWKSDKSVPHDELLLRIVQSIVIESLSDYDGWTADKVEDIIENIRIRTRIELAEGQTHRKYHNRPSDIVHKSLVDSGIQSIHIEWAVEGAIIEWIPKYERFDDVFFKNLREIVEGYDGWSEERVDEIIDDARNCGENTTGSRSTSSGSDWTHVAEEVLETSDDE